MLFKKTNRQLQEKKLFDTNKWKSSIKAFLLWIFIMLSMWFLFLTTKISDDATSIGMTICAIIFMISFILMKKAFYIEYEQKKLKKERVRKEIEKYE